MNINRMTDEDLAESIRVFVGNKLNKKVEFDSDYYIIAEFIRQCVKDSMPTEGELAEIVNDHVPVIYSNDISDLSHALHEVMEEK